MCGTANKMESVFCAKCGARLVPLTVAPADEKPQPSAPPIKGLSLPTKPTLDELPSEPQKIEPESESEPESTEEQAKPDDWLARLRNIPPEENEPTQEEENEQVPDWLKAIDSKPEEQKPAQPELTPSDEIPEWLQAIRPAELPAEEPTPEVVDESQIPDWLRSASEESQAPIAKEPEPEQKPEPEPAPQAQEPQIEPSIEAAIESQPQAELKTESASIEPSVEEPVATPAAEQEMPTWHQELKPQEAETSEPVVEVPFVAPAAEEEIPVWLQQLKPKEAETTIPVVEEPVMAEETPLAEPLMESLEAQTSAEPVAEVVEQPAWARQTIPALAESDEDIPDWLRTVPATSEIGAEPSELLLGAEMVPEIQPALPEEVPAWLASLKPASALVEEDTVETSGPLEGLRGVLPLAVAIAEPHASAQSTQVPAKIGGGQIFESILAAPRTEAATPAVTAKRRTVSMRPFVFLLIALAALVPFFIPSDWMGAALPISNTPASEFYDAIQALPANATVLVSFDYDAGQSGEMDLQANAVLRHLIQRRAKIITISTLDTGAPIANRVLNNVTQNLTGYAYGTNYVNLGYLPGHETALRGLVANGFAPTLRDFSQSQALTNFSGFSTVKTLRDVALIVEFAGSEDALKIWMEQVQPNIPTKIVAGVSAGVEPKAKVYHDTPTKQLAAMISGAFGAAQYEILSNQPSMALSSINAQGVVLLALVLIIVLGNIALFASRGRKQNA